MTDLRSSLLKKRATAMPPKADGGEAQDAAAGGADDPNPRYGKLKLSTTAQMKHGGRKYFDSADRKTVGLPAPSAAAAGGAPSSHATVAHGAGGKKIALNSGGGSAAAGTATDASGGSTSPAGKLASPTGDPSIANLTLGASGGSSGGAAGASGSGSGSSPPNASRPMNKPVEGVKGGGGAGGGAAGGGSGTGDLSDIDKADTIPQKKPEGPPPSVAAPVPPETVINSDGKEEPSAKRMRVTPKQGSPSAGPSSTSSPPGTSTGQVHIGAHGKATADVLLVEDVRVSQRIAQVALSKARFKVDVASTAEEAVSKFQTMGPFKIVLMDIQLPKMNGMEATQIIRDFEEALEKSKAAAAAAPADGKDNSSAAGDAAAAAASSTVHMSPTGIGLGGAVVGTHPRSLIFGLTGAVEEENLRQYKAVGMNGCIAKGKLLAEALKTAIERIGVTPNEFVNLVSM